jgi:perosamine synthetase
LSVWEKNKLKEYSETPLALLGGEPTRRRPFQSRPHIDETERAYLNDCLEQKLFSRFVGSPVGDFRRYLAMPSAEVANLEDFWSVLGGPYVRLFEEAFAQRHGATFAISMNSCTACLTASMHALGLGVGDEVITTPFSFTATATALHAAGVRVRFADIDPETLCITPGTVDRVISSKTKAVVPVHVMGNAGHVLELEQYCEDRNLLMIEDSAQALWSRVGGRVLGTIGAVGVFSFQESKNLMTGEGGMALTSSDEIAYRLRLVRNHGEAMVFEEDSDDRIRAAVGYNFRLPEPLAAIGLAQVGKIDYLNGIRVTNYRYLAKALSRWEFIKPQRVTNDPGGFYPYCAAFLFDSQSAGFSRNSFVAALRAEGIPVATGFPRLMSQNLLFRDSQDPVPNALQANYETCFGFFQIGYPNTHNDMNDIIMAVQKIVENRKSLINWTDDAHSYRLSIGR